MKFKNPKYKIIQRTDVLPLANNQSSWGIDKYLKGEQRAGDGEGCVVYVCDSGISESNSHVTFRDRIIARKSFTNDGLHPSDIHGGAVAGVIASNDPRIGLAPRVELVDVRVLSKSGGTINMIVNGLKWILEHSKTHNKQSIVNMSLGAQGATMQLTDICRELELNNVILVCASGNDTHHVDYPAALPSTIAVAATDRYERISAYSSKGKEVDCAAPGTAIWTTSGEFGYTQISGTSFAAPFVTGMICKYLSRNK